MKFRKCKIKHLFKHYFWGISFIGIAAFVIQEIPYIAMPLIKPASNPIMNMTNEIKWIETVQGIFGVLTMILLMLIVRDDVKLIPRETAKDKIFFSLAVLMIVINFLGWTMYYMGYQYGWLILISQHFHFAFQHNTHVLYQSLMIEVDTCIGIIHILLNSHRRCICRKIKTL